MNKIFEEKQPLVSVCVFAYNLERYISKAIESALMQKTTFDFEILIGEDKSTDRTREICRDYALKYPDIIKLLLRDQNYGMIKNVFDTLKEAHGKYVAILDADDYWIDPLKLQKQVDFMQVNEDFVLCCHNCIVLYEDHDIQPYMFNPRNQKSVIPIDDIIMNWSMATATILYRNSAMSFPDIVYKAHNFDLAIQILLADKGKVGYLKEPMAVYRKTLASNSFNPKYPFDFVYDQQIELFTSFNEYFNYKYIHLINNKIKKTIKIKRNLKRINKYPILKIFNLKRIIRIMLSLKNKYFFKAILFPYFTMLFLPLIKTLNIKG